MMNQYPRPENIPNLTVPTTNSVIYDEMRKRPLVVEGTVCKILKMLATVIMLAVQLICDIGDKKMESRPIQALPG